MSPAPSSKRHQPTTESSVAKVWGALGAVAKGAGAGKTVARVHHSSLYDRRHYDYAEQLNIDRRVCPELITAVQIAGCLRSPGAMAVEHFARERIEMQQLAVTDGALALMALAGMEFFAFAVFPVGLALASKLGAGQTGAAAGVVFGVSGLMTAACQPLVGALGESLGDIREALGWVFPVALVAVLLASRLEKAPPGTGR